MATQPIRPARFHGPAPVNPAIVKPTLLLALLALASCSGGASDEKFAPPCPVPSIPRDTSDLHRFRGAGRDIVDTVIDGRITGVGGSCTRGEPGITTATISVGMEISRGPAAPGREATISYFVAVTEGERLVDKQVFNLRAEFPANTDRLRLSGDEIELRLPVSATKTAAAYRISVGFQLTPEELQVNRSLPRR